MRISDWSSDVCSSDLGTYQRKLRHRVGICPASTDLGIEPLAEDRVGKAAENCERSYRVEAGLRPARVAGKYECPEQGHAGDEDITASAMDHGKEDLLHAPFVPDGVERQQIGRAACRERGCQYVEL